MRTLVVVTTVALLAGVPAVTAQGPTATPEHKALAYFAGTWNFSGTAKESPMGPGGTVTFTETCELMPGGFALVCRSEGKSPMGPVKAVAIMGYDAEKKAYTYTAAESDMPVFTALGQHEGEKWNWRSEMKMGSQSMTTRVTVTEGGPKSYDMTIEMSMDGKSFVPMMEGKATRVSS